MFWQWVKRIGSLAGVLFIVVAIYRYGRLEERVDTTTQTVKDLAHKHDKANDKFDEAFQRLTKLEAQFDAAAKNGTSTKALAADVELLRQELATRQAEERRLQARIDALEARLQAAGTQPSEP